MHWKLKALIQNAIAALPSRASYHTYYWMQRHFGGLRRVNPLPEIQSALEIAAAILKHGRCIAQKSFLEVGTGRTLNLPITMWLLGAHRVTTVDLNPYLKFELVADDLDYIRTHQAEVIELLTPFQFDTGRFQRLLEFDARRQSLAELLTMCRIQYFAPADATRLPLGDGAVTFHVSSNVCEHISKRTLSGILKEGARVVDANGLCVHRIDHSDHFAHSDPKLSKVNFLRYSDAHWALLSGNRYMFMNRLQMDDFQKLFEQNNHKVLSVEANIDSQALSELCDGSLRLNPRFEGKPLETLATLRSIFVSWPRATSDIGR
jgi:Methyltransferase domain